MSVATTTTLGKSSVLGLARTSSNSSIPRSIPGNNPPPGTPSLEQELSTSIDNLDYRNASAAQLSLHDDTTILADSSTTTATTSNNTIQPDPTNPHHRHHLPHPIPPSQCPLLCVFYAEFDIVIGPRVCYQSPQKFMQLDVDVNVDEIHHALEETFLAVLPKEEEKALSDMQKEKTKESDDTNNHQQVDDSPDKHEHDDYWKWPSNMKRPPIVERDLSDASTSRSSSIPVSKHNASSTSNITAAAATSALDVDGNSNSTGSKSLADANIIASPATITKPIHERKQSDSSTLHSVSHSRNPSFASSSKGTTSNLNQQLPHNEKEGDNSTIDTELLQNSIFAATSEYIITGNELANRSITVSTHGMHILSRPQIIRDTQRYERNSLLFAVGFVLRREEDNVVDPRHFWPVLSKLSSTLYDMEVESEFLSNSRSRSQIQIILEDVLISLNSKQMDCHLLLDNANLMNLQLFHPPPAAPTPPVPDYAVPILLRPEWQLQMYDWDLTINWIVPHIDGCQYVKQIAASTEVDMEMVRACLRVLRHHGVLTHVDVFRYSNVYEFQGYERLGTGGGSEKKRKKKADTLKRLLTEAFWYSAKSKYVSRSQPTTNNTPTFGNIPVAPWVSKKQTPNNFAHESAFLAPRSFPSLTGHFPMRKEHSPDDDNSRGERSGYPNKKEIELMTEAIEQLYSSLNRDKSFGDVLLEKIAGLTDPFDSETSLATPPSDKNVNLAHGTNDDDHENEPRIDWNRVFDYFDHRRLVTFGLFQGLIRRVHQYPLAYRIETDNYDANIRDDRREEKHGDDTDNGVGLELSAVAEEAAFIAAGMTMDERSMVTSCSASPLQSNIAPLSFSGRGEMLQHKASQKEMYLRSGSLLLEKIALAMDGTRCDDELSCMFDVPIEKLIEMLQATGRWNVISVYSCVD